MWTKEKVLTKANSSNHPRYWGTPRLWGRGWKGLSSQFCFGAQNADSFYFSQGRVCSPIQPFSEFPWHFVPIIQRAVLWVVSSYGQDSYSFSDYYFLIQVSYSLSNLHLVGRGVTPQN